MIIAQCVSACSCVLQRARLILSPPQGEMTKEDVSEHVKADSVPGWVSSDQRPVIHQVASAPMPSDCGEPTHTHTHTHITISLFHNKYNPKTAI